MNINMNTSTALSQNANTNPDVGLTVLKKAIDVEAQGAMALINAIPQPAVNLPPHLGQNINTTA